MRSQRTADRQAIERTLSTMVALLESGVETVRCERVVRLLGRELKVAGPAPDQERVSPDPRADPMTGCLPVAPDPGVR